jgi:hypothetical protein
MSSQKEEEISNINIMNSHSNSNISSSLQSSDNNDNDIPIDETMTEAEVMMAHNTRTSIQDVE